MQAGAGTAGFVGNALLGGPIGAGWDVASGAMTNLTPNPLNVVLDSLPLAAETSAKMASP